MFYETLYYWKTKNLEITFFIKYFIKVIISKYLGDITTQIILSMIKNSI